MSGYEDELYGYLPVIDALALVAGKSLGLRVYSYGPENDSVVDAVRLAGAQSGVRLEWFRGQGKEQFHKGVRNSRAYIRNTAADTFGLAVAEALALGVPVIATDVCPRPEGVFIVPLGSMKDLHAAIENVANRDGPETRVFDLAALERSADRALEDVERAYMHACENSGNS